MPTRRYRSSVHKNALSLLLFVYYRWVVWIGGFQLSCNSGVLDVVVPVARAEEAGAVEPLPAEDAAASNNDDDDDDHVDDAITRETTDPCPLFGQQCFENPMYLEFFELWHQHIQIWNPDSTPQKNNTVITKLYEKSQYILAHWVHFFPDWREWQSLASLEVVLNRYGEKEIQKNVQNRLCFSALILSAFVSTTESALMPIIPQAVRMVFDVLKICRAGMLVPRSTVVTPGDSKSNDPDDTAAPVTSSLSKRSTVQKKLYPKLLNSGTVPKRPSDNQEVAAWPCCVQEDIDVMSEFSKHPAWNELLALNRTSATTTTSSSVHPSEVDLDHSFSSFERATPYRFNTDFFSFFKVTPQQLLYRMFLVISSRSFAGYIQLSGLRAGMLNLFSYGKYYVENLGEFGRGRQRLAVDDRGQSITEHTKSQFFSGDGSMTLFGVKNDTEGAGAGLVEMEVEHDGNSDSGVVEQAASDDGGSEEPESSDTASTPDVKTHFVHSIANMKIKGQLELKRLRLKQEIEAERKKRKTDIDLHAGISNAKTIAASTSSDEDEDEPDGSTAIAETTLRDPKQMLFPVSLMQNFFQLGYRYLSITGFILWAVIPGTNGPPEEMVAKKGIDFGDFHSRDTEKGKKQKKKWRKKRRNKGTKDSDRDGRKGKGKGTTRVESNKIASCRKRIRDSRGSSADDKVFKGSRAGKSAIAKASSSVASRSSSREVGLYQTKKANTRNRKATLKTNPNLVYPVDQSLNILEPLYAVPINGIYDKLAHVMHFDFDSSIWLGNWVKQTKRSAFWNMEKLVFHVKDAVRFSEVFAEETEFLVREEQTDEKGSEDEEALYDFCDDAIPTTSEHSETETDTSIPAGMIDRQKGSAAGSAAATGAASSTSSKSASSTSDAVDQEDEEEGQQDADLQLEESAEDLKEKHDYLILDVGMGLGADTMFYLHSGFHVVTVESNPNSIFRARQQFEKELSTGQLILLNYAIVSEEKAEDLYRNSTFVQLSPRAETSKLVNNDEMFWRTMFVSDGTTQHRRNVRIKSQWIPSLSCASLVKQFGMPYFLKIDVEENSKDCLRSILTDGIWVEKSRAVLSSSRELRADGKYIDENDPKLLFGGNSRAHNEFSAELAARGGGTTSASETAEEDRGKLSEAERKQKQEELFKYKTNLWYENNKKIGDINKFSLYEETQGGFYVRKVQPRDNLPPVYARIDPPKYISIEIDSMRAFARSVFPTAEALGYNRFKIARQYIYAPKICLYRDEPCGAGLFGELAVDAKFGTRWRTRDELLFDIDWMREILKGSDWFDLHMTRK
ncbi:unnamed protein product [Amoebophrya sp. A120]|nr:unnamed protein product [Amoebophrya sp. A120]|eukprot:GSA120T00020452001.1